MLIKAEMLDIAELEPTVNISGNNLLFCDSIKEDSNESASNIPMDGGDIDENKPIAQLTNLKQKRITHRCNVCSQYFQKKHRYEAHMRSHEGLKVRIFSSF